MVETMGVVVVAVDFAAGAVVGIAGEVDVAVVDVVVAVAAADGDDHLRGAF